MAFLIGTGLLLILGGSIMIQGLLNHVRSPVPVRVPVGAPVSNRRPATRGI